MEEGVAVVPQMFADGDDGDDKAKEDEEQIDIDLVLYELQLARFLAVELVLHFLQYVHFIILL